MNILEKNESTQQTPTIATAHSQSTLKILQQFSGSLTRPTLAALSTVDPRIGACATIAYHSWTLLHSYFASKAHKTSPDVVTHSENNPSFSHHKK